jgi:hypothetical protein
MSSFLYTLEGWPSSPASNSVAREYNNDTNTWSTIHSTPFTGQVVSTSTGVRQTGGWDGNKWYVIGPDGKLYAYSPLSDTWSSALVGGTAIVGGTVEDQNWCMCSDGRFVYILASSGDFRRYDPTADTLTSLSLLGGSYGAKLFLVFDGDDSIYGYKGDTSGQFYKYTISTGVWATIATQATLVSDISVGVAPCAVFLQGKLYIAYGFGGTTVKAFGYTPGSNTWAALATAALGSFAPNPDCRYGEDTDGSFRLWQDGAAQDSAIYTIGTNAWAAGSPSGINFNQGGNWVVTRAFSPDYLWLAADGVTPTDPTESQGTAATGEVDLFHYKIQTPVSRAGGATVSVVATPLTDAEDCVTICQTENGTFGTTFTTAALNANDVFDVFVKLSPTNAQSLGLNKLYNLKVV